MKKRLLLLLCLSTVLIGCGEVTVSYKGSGQRTSRTTSTSTEVVEIDPYYGINYGSTNTYGVEEFIDRFNTYGYRGMSIEDASHTTPTSDNTFNVTPRGISELDTSIKVFYMKDAGIFIQTDRMIYCYVSTEKQKTIEKFAFHDYDNNGATDIVIWTRTGKSRGFYMLDYFDASRTEFFCVGSLQYESRDDFEFTILQSSSSGPIPYINNKRVYYVNNQFYCTGIFDYRYPTYY